MLNIYIYIFFLIYQKLGDFFGTNASESIIHWRRLVYTLTDKVAALDRSLQFDIQSNSLL